MTNDAVRRMLYLSDLKVTVISLLYWENNVRGLQLITFDVIAQHSDEVA